MHFITGNDKQKAVSLYFRNFSTILTFNFLGLFNRQNF